jgi:hypothetical protein
MAGPSKTRPAAKRKRRPESPSNDRGRAEPGGPAPRHPGEGNSFAQQDVRRLAEAVRAGGAKPKKAKKDAKKGGPTAARRRTRARRSSPRYPGNKPRNSPGPFRVARKHLSATAVPPPGTAVAGFLMRDTHAPSLGCGKCARTIPSRREGWGGGARRARVDRARTAHPPSLKGWDAPAIAYQPSWSARRTAACRPARLVRRAHRQGPLALPRDLVDPVQALTCRRIELPPPAALDQPVVARADAEHEVGVVVGVPLQDLEEAAHPRAFGQRVHDEVVHHVLAAVPPVLPVVPQLAQVLADRRVAADLALPQWSNSASSAKVRSPAPRRRGRCPRRSARTAPRSRRGPRPA